MAIQSQNRKLKNIFLELEENKLVLPNFQRTFVWENEKQKSLIASLLVSLPIGSLLILDGKASAFTKRKLCFPDDLEVEGNCEYVLDGQQRLSTLRTVFYDIFEEKNWESVWSSIYGKLKNRWFLRVIPLDAEEDIFGYTKLEYEPLHRLVDNDITDFIEPKKVHKTKVQELHHPVYTPTDNQGHQIEKQHEKRNEIANKFADEGIIPLYEISKGNKGLHRKVIEKIAHSRVETLKANAADKGHSYAFYSEYFKDYSEEELKEFIESHTSDDGFDESGFTQDWAKKSAKWCEQFSSDLEAALEKEMSIIHLDSSEVVRAVAIFEAINRGGEPLTVYDLIVAKSARNSNVKNLSTKISDLLQIKIEIPEFMNDRYAAEYKVANKLTWSSLDMSVLKDNEPSKKIKDWFVNMLSLIVYVQVAQEDCKVDHIKRQKILDLSPENVNDYWEKAIIAIQRALCFIQLRCGVPKATDVQYNLMLIVLAFHLSKDEIWLNKDKQNIIEYWYWVALLGGGYNNRQNEQCIDDILLLEKLLSGDKDCYKTKESRVLNSQDYLTEDMLLRKDDSNEKESTSVRNVLLQFILSSSPADFLKSSSGQEVHLSPWKVASDELVVELHHIIPLGNVSNLAESSSKLRKDKSHILNSSLNLVYILKSTNRSIRDKSPDQYLNMIEQNGLMSNFIPEAQDFKDAIDQNEYDKVLKHRWSFLKRDVNSRINKLKISLGN